MIQALLTPKQANLLKQGWRFVRLFVPVFIGEVAVLPGPVTEKALLALIPGALEVAYRQWRPVAPVDGQ